MVRAEYYYRRELAERGESPPPDRSLRDKYKRDDVCSHLRNLASWRGKDGTVVDVVDAIYAGGFEQVCFGDSGLDSIHEITDMQTVDPRDYTKHFVAL